MRLVARSAVFEFEPVPLEFSAERFTNVFARKNNRTTRQTLLQRRYAKLAPEVEAFHSYGLDMGLGEFLLHLKTQGVPLYRRFLNRHGDGIYCAFRLADNSAATLRGVYAYSVRGELKYIGRCRDSFAKRVNMGYGRIHPKNCYLDGQSTNCHLNSLIAQHVQADVSLHVLPMTDPDEIAAVERALIARYQPEWNVALRRVAPST